MYPAGDTCVCVSHRAVYSQKKRNPCADAITHQHRGFVVSRRLTRREKYNTPKLAVMVALTYYLLLPPRRTYAHAAGAFKSSGTHPGAAAFLGRSGRRPLVHQEHVRISSSTLILRNLHNLFFSLVGRA